MPLLVGILATELGGDPSTLEPIPARTVGAVLILAFCLWNGWSLWLMRRHRTALLPGGSTRVILDRGPFGMSRNPLYLGMTALDAGVALLWPSFWALALVPAGFALTWWGAVLPEERYLAAKFGDAYLDYCSRVRRWL